MIANMQNLDTYLHTLNKALESNVDKECIEQMSQSVWLSEHELAQATHALICQTHQLSTPNLSLNVLPSGAIPLFQRAFYPWGALPYPLEHAQLGILLAKLGEKERAQAISNWQYATTDHQHQPQLALFEQEGRVTLEAIQKANQTLFELIPPQNSSFPFVDPDLGLIAIKEEHTNLLSVASGCKSGMGTYLSYDCGLLNYGPHIKPIRQFQGFGLAGRPIRYKHEPLDQGFHTHFQTRLAAPHPNHKSPFPLEDSGYSGLWVTADHHFQGRLLSVSCQFEGFKSIDALQFTLFGKGTSCRVAKSHRLAPKSLDRYQGPFQPLLLEGAQGAFCIEEAQGVEAMEVIPLAGDNHFWGADFLITLTLNSPKFVFICYPSSKS